MSLNYPCKKTNSSNKKTSVFNKGMDLEEDINISNKFYLDNNIAVIYKKPTPISIIKVDYKNKSPIINKAFFSIPSTTDYNGLYKSKYIDFEAKETKNKNFFPIKNILPHQIKHLITCLNHGGVCFIIILFKFYKECYLVNIKDILTYLEPVQSNIPYKFIKEKGYLIKYRYMPRLDYLKEVEKIL